MNDNKELDGTPFAYPAYWRCLDDCLQSICFKINKILDARDDGRGISNEPWESTKRHLLELVNEK